MCNKHRKSVFTHVYLCGALSEYSPQRHPGPDNHVFFSKDVTNAQKNKGLGYDGSQHIALGTEEKQDVEYCFRAEENGH